VLILPHDPFLTRNHQKSEPNVGPVWDFGVWAETVVPGQTEEGTTRGKHRNAWDHGRAEGDLAEPP